LYYLLLFNKTHILLFSDMQEKPARPDGGWWYKKADKITGARLLALDIV